MSQRAHDGDAVSRSLAALIPETLSALSQVLGPESAQDLLLSPESYRRLLYTLTTTDLSPTVRVFFSEILVKLIWYYVSVQSAALFLANQRDEDGVQDSSYQNDVWIPEVPIMIQSRRSRSSIDRIRYGRLVESPRSMKQGHRSNASQIADPDSPRCSNDATFIGRKLWRRIVELDTQMAEVAEQYVHNQGAW